MEELIVGDWSETRSGRETPPDRTDAARSGLAYLTQIQQFELQPGLINRFSGDSERQRYYTWIAAHHSRLNALLAGHLQACADCFYPENRPRLEIYAAPLVPEFAIDAFCNIRRPPGVIVVDLGRVVTADWLRVVVHEYAHAMVGSGGHSPRFGAIADHLCLGLGLQVPPATALSDTQLRSYPPCQARPHPLSFWRGEET
jgi:hypothetical protein